MGLEKGSNTGQPRMKHFVYVVSEVPWHVKNMIQGNWSLESNLKDYFDMSILSDLCQCHVSTELRWTWKRPFLHWKKLLKLKSDEVLSFVGMSMEQARSKTHLETPRASPASNLLHRSPAWPTSPPTHRPTPLIEPMGCLWPCNQCSVDGHCFGLFCNQYTMFRWQSSVSNHWFVFGCFGLVFLQPMFGGWTLYWIVLHFLDLCRDEALYAEHGVSRGTFLLGCSVLVCSGQIKMDFFFLLHSRLLWILPRTRIVFFYVCVTRLALQHLIRKQNFHKCNVTLSCKM